MIKGSSVKDYFWHFDPKEGLELADLDSIGYVYHYTTIDAFKSIIEGKVLYASRFDFLNDETERQDILHVLERVIEEQKDAKDFYECLKSIKLCNQNSYVATYYGDNGLVAEHYNEEEVFFISCCKEPDNWTMWNTYVKEKSKGVSMGFCIDRPFIKRCNRKQNSFLVEVVQIVYDKETKEKIIRKHIEEVRKRYTGSDEDRIYLSQIIKKLIGFYQDRFKYEKFCEEKEIRIVVVKDKTKTDLPVRYRKSGSSIVPYVELDYSKELLVAPPDAVKNAFGNNNKTMQMVNSKESRKYKLRITISPFSTIKEDEIRELVKGEGFVESSIKTSKIPIRKELM